MISFEEDVDFDSFFFVEKFFGENNLPYIPYSMSNAMDVISFSFKNGTDVFKKVLF